MSDNELMQDLAARLTGLDWRRGMAGFHLAIDDWQRKVMKVKSVCDATWS
jgi:hypothetical protein